MNTEEMNNFKACTQFDLNELENRISSLESDLNTSTMYTYNLSEVVFKLLNLIETNETFTKAHQDELLTKTMEIASSSFVG